MKRRRYVEGKSRADTHAPDIVSEGGYGKSLPKPTPKKAPEKPKGGK